MTLASLVDVVREETVARGQAPKYYLPESRGEMVERFAESGRMKELLGETLYREVQRAYDKTASRTR